MGYYISRHRLTYTPAGGTPMVLLEAGDWCDSPLTLAADLAAQVEQPILASWATHHSRGNAQTQMEFTHYAAAATHEAAALAGITRWQELISHPEGELLLETAFAGPNAQVQLRLHATLTRCRWEDMSGSIFAPRPGLAMNYCFIVSPITD